MSEMDHYRQQAKALYDLAKTTTDRDLGLIYILRAMEFEAMADDAAIKRVRDAVPQADTAAQPRTASV